MGELTICHGGADHRFSWNCLEDTATLAETRPVTIKDPVWQAGQSFADESPQKVLFVLHKEREISAFTKLAVSEFDQKELFCEIPPNALTCIPLTPIMQWHF